jgi:hypothetical protein
MTIFEAMADPQTRHAALGHLPIALSVVVLLLALASAIWCGRNATLRWTTVVACALLVLTALITVQSGEDADAQLTGLLPADVTQLIHDHEERAEKVWIFGVVTGVLVALAVIRGRTALVMSWLAVLGGAATVGWLALTAHDGGTLVYAYGVGTPLSLTDRQAQGSPTADADGQTTTDADGQTTAEPALDDGGDARLVHFRQRVWPVLEENCIRCHNPVRAARAGRLDQTTIAGMLAGGRLGPAVVPGHPEDSWLLIAMRHEDDLIMPPEQEALGPEAIADVEQWIIDGAVWDQSVVPVPTDQDDTEP